jgi:cbb3-type cytochrome oxidase subunit 1
MGVFGFSAMIALGGIYYILPRITGKPLYSGRLADVQYWLLNLGMTGFFLVLTAGGLVQGNAWLNGTTVYRTLPMIHIYFILRASIGLFFIGAAFIGAYNVIMSIRGEQAQGERIFGEAFQGELQ